VKCGLSASSVFSILLHSFYASAGCAQRTHCYVFSSCSVVCHVLISTHPQCIRIHRPTWIQPQGRQVHSQVNMDLAAGQVSPFPGCHGFSCSAGESTPGPTWIHPSAQANMDLGESMLTWEFVNASPFLGHHGPACRVGESITHGNSFSFSYEIALTCTCGGIKYCNSLYSI